MNKDIYSTMRKTHNSIKYRLLEECVNGLRRKNKDRKLILLDLGVGRCNDIYKWKKLDINEIHGIDASEKQLEMGRERLSREKDIEKRVTLYKIDLANANIEKEFESFQKIKFDIIISFFSIHYFVHNMPKILETITTNRDAILIITYMELFWAAKLINSIRKEFNNNDQASFENDLLKIEFVNETHIKSYFKNTPYFSEQSSFEKIINNLELTNQIKNFSLSNVGSFLDMNIENLYTMPVSFIETELMHKYMIFKKPTN